MTTFVIYFFRGTLVLILFNFVGWCSLRLSVLEGREKIAVCTVAIPLEC